MLIQERLDAGYEGISAREVWLNLDDDLKSVRHTYRQVANAIAANDCEVPSVFRPPKGEIHATSFSCFCSVSQISKNRIGD